MIDEKYQNQGIVKIALKKFLEFFVNKYGHIKLYTSDEVDNTVALDLYEKRDLKRKKYLSMNFQGYRA